MDRRSFLKIAGACTMGLTAPGLFTTALSVKKTFAASAKQIRHKIADSHFHYLDFLQQTEGMQSLLASMDANGVEHIMFSGMPLTKKWDAMEPEAPQYYLDDNGRTYWYTATDFIVARRYQELPETLKPRFHPFICGINATDKYAVLHVERMLQEFPDTWQGIGEVFGHRDDLTNLTYGETARVSHPAMDDIYALAAERGMPVCMHSNVTTRTRLKKLAYLHEVREAVKRHPDTTFIWAHAGLSRYLDVEQKSYTALLRELLQQYPNLNIDLSWIIFENYVLTHDSQNVRPEWLSLVADFDHRFMIGSDNIGHFESYPRNIMKYYTLLDALAPEAASRVAMENFLSLLPETKTGTKALKDAA